MDEKEKKIEQLLADHRFIDWVLDPNSIYKEYWHTWMAANEEQAAVAEAARTFLLELRSATTEGPAFGDNATDSLWTQIHQSIVHDEATVGTQSVGSNPTTAANSSLSTVAGNDLTTVTGNSITTAANNSATTATSNDGTTTSASTKRSAFRPWQWVAAAAITGLVIIGAISYFNHGTPQAQQAEIVNIETTAASPVLVRYNGTDKNQLVFLPDGSKVTLAKGAQITYNRLMNGEKRDVQLQGEAFFDVAKNPARPFLIYTQKMVVKVLGTSFRVVSQGGNEAVYVKTGKVSVYLKGQNTEQAAANILLPKQACTFSEKEKALHKASYTSPAAIDLATDSRQEYVFEDAPIDSVFNTLEVMYDLPVHYDRKAFEHCFINISLGNEKLEEKLAVITQTINASYTLSDKGITITGEGCK